MKSAVFRWLPSEVSPDEQRDVDAIGKPAVRGHAELAHRLLVPAVPGLGEGMADVLGGREVECRRPVVHQVDVLPDVSPHLLAEVGVALASPHACSLIAG